MPVAQSVVDICNAIASRLAGEWLGLVHVVEYPKCGGSWVARLLRCYTGIDRVFGQAAIVRRGAVIQKHILYRPYLNKPIVVLRDPRDVWVSFYFHELYHNEYPQLRKQIGFDPAAPDSENMLRYITVKLEHPECSSPGFSYSRFVDDWMDRSEAHVARYEELSRDTAGELGRMIRFIDQPVDEERVASTVEAQAFQKISGRKPGQEDRSSHKRKGIVGDWRNYFTPTIAELVRARQQALLERLGYESCGSWVDTVSPDGG